MLLLCFVDRDPRECWDTFAATWGQVIVSGAGNSGNVTAMLSHFADDAVLRLDPPLPPPIRPVYQGRDEIREYLWQLVQNGFHVEAGDFYVAGNEVSWQSLVSADLFRRMGVDQAAVSSSAVIEGGQIRSMTIHYSPQALQQMQAALAMMQAPA